MCHYMVGVAERSGKAGVGFGGRLLGLASILDVSGSVIDLSTRASAAFRSNGRVVAFMDVWMTWTVVKCPVGRNRGHRKVLGNVTVKARDAATIWGHCLRAGWYSSVDERVHKASG